MKHGVIHLVYLNGNHLLQLMQALLHLNCFCRFIAKALDKLAYVGHFLLLVFPSTELGGTTLLTQLHILVVFHTIVDEFSA